MIIPSEFRNKVVGMHVCVHARTHISSRQMAPSADEHRGDSLDELFPVDELNSDICHFWIHIN